MKSGSDVIYVSNKRAWRISSIKALFTITTTARNRSVQRGEKESEEGDRETLRRNELSVTKQMHVTMHGAIQGHQTEGSCVDFIDI